MELLARLYASHRDEEFLPARLQIAHHSEGSTTVVGRDGLGKREVAANYLEPLELTAEWKRMNARLGLSLPLDFMKRDATQEGLELSHAVAKSLPQGHDWTKVAGMR